MAVPADAPGLQYRRARYYDPLVGQFTQLDPIGFGGGLNLYGYANGDPVNFRDPSGLMAQEAPPCEAGRPLSECDSPDARLLLHQAGENPCGDGAIYLPRYDDCRPFLIGEPPPWLGGPAAKAASGVKAIGSNVWRRISGLKGSWRMFWNIRYLRSWARSNGFVRWNGGGPERWGVYDDAGNFKWMLRIKRDPSPRPGLQPGSHVPRFDARLGDGQYINPFTGEVGGRSVGAHLPLQRKW